MSHVKYFRVLTYLTLILFLLPVVTNNLPVGGEYVRMLILGIWLVSILFFAPSILRTNVVSGIILYYFILIFGIVTWWHGMSLLGAPIDFSVLKREMPWVLVAMMSMLCLLRNQDFIGYRNATWIAIASISLTCISSLIIFSVDPMASRGYISQAAEYENAGLTHRLGLISYSMISGLAVCMPLFVWYIKRSKGWKRLLMTIFVFLCFYTIFKSQQSTATLLAFVALLFSFAYSKNKVRNLFLGIVALGILIFSDEIIPYSLGLFLENISPDSDIYDRFSDIQGVTSGAVELENSYLGTSRFALIEISLESFFRNPLIGGGKAGGHSYWIDRLGLYGLMIAIPWFIIWKHYIKTSKRVVSRDFFQYQAVSIVFIFIYGILKGIGGAEFFIIIFFLSTGIYLLNNYSETNLYGRSK